MPGWFVRVAPALIGAAIALGDRTARRKISEQLSRVRGRTGPVRDLLDVVRTFANFASCLTDVLARGSKNELAAEVSVDDAYVAALLASAPGIIFVTAHTAGWERLGSLLASTHRRRVTIVMQRERDPDARDLQDRVRAADGAVTILHVGDDPLGSLPLLRHLRGGGVVALQIDRVPRGMAGRTVRLFGQPGSIPEGPLRLAQLTGAPIVPVFSARTARRRYSTRVCPALHVARDADAGELDAAAQTLAGYLEAFVRAHPTQWFAFGD